MSEDFVVKRHREIKEAFENGWAGYPRPGEISLRDRFAMIALDRCIKAAADPDVPFGRTCDIASKAYEIADAMMKARKGKE